VGGRFKRLFFGAALASAATLVSATSEAAGPPLPGGCAAVSSIWTRPAPANIGYNEAISGFVAGDVVAITVQRLGTASQVVLWALDGFLTTLLDDTATTDLVFTHTVQGTNDRELRLHIDVTPGGGGSQVAFSATCVSAAAKSKADSDKLRSLQIAGSKVAAQTSGAAISSAIDGAIGDALMSNGNGSGGGANPIPSFLGGPGAYANRAISPSRLGGSTPASAGYDGGHRWSPWVNVKHSEFDGGSAGFDGDQLNTTFGLSYRLTRDVVVGIVGGFEHFDYDVSALTGRIKGDGWTAGGYLGWQIQPAIRFAAAIAHSDIDYDARAGAASGSFDGRRLLLNASLTGSYPWWKFVIEPSATVFALWENQDGWTDSLGTQQGERSFTLGRASAGAKVSHVIELSRSVSLVPYAGLYFDYDFSSDAAVTVGPDAVGLDDGPSGRATAGLALGLGTSTRLSVEAEYGGIGADHDVWTLAGRGAVKF
jgi:hypothetical protein